jgi:hypothetical protein
MTAPHWLERLQWLLQRFPEYGIGADLTGMALADLWGVYRLLEGLSMGAQHGPTP